MLRHYITKYEENGQRYAEAWLQIDFFGKFFCFSRKRISLTTSRIHTLVNLPYPLYHYHRLISVC